MSVAVDSVTVAAVAAVDQLNGSWSRRVAAASFGQLRGRGGRHGRPDQLSQDQDDHPLIDLCPHSSFPPDPVPTDRAIYRLLRSVGCYANYANCASTTQSTC